MRVEEEEGGGRGGRRKRRAEEEEGGTIKVFFDEQHVSYVTDDLECLKESKIVSTSTGKLCSLRGQMHTDPPLKHTCLSTLYSTWIIIILR